MEVSLCYPQALFGIELCHLMIMLMELVRDGDATFTACCLVLSWISREGSKDNLINVATEMRSMSPQNQTRSATTLTIHLMPSLISLIKWQMNNVRRWGCIKVVFIKLCNNIYECTELCMLRSTLLILPFPRQRAWRTTRFFSGRFIRWNMSCFAKSHEKCSLWVDPHIMCEVVCC
jgi:hypothetical protein